jgi:hypothetical protein
MKLHSVPKRAVSIDWVGGGVARGASHLATLFLPLICLPLYGENGVPLAGKDGHAGGVLASGMRG